ncbi:hypothetical protein CP8484711_1170B, partial [Chlamydia psittaci 84-8471/1]
VSATRVSLRILWGQ